MSNQILKFADTATNLPTQNEYLNDADRNTGNIPGVAKSRLNNKALRQAAFIANMIGNYIFDRTGESVLDDNDSVVLQANFRNAISKLPTIQRFTSGSGTYTKPADVRYIEVEMVGGGGSGGSGGTTGNNGAVGTATTFGTALLNCNGGGAGAWAGTESGGIGGTASLGTGPVGNALQGGRGGTSSFNGNNVNLYSAPAAGASTPFGGGGIGGGINATGVLAQANSGGGGGGGGTNAVVYNYSGAGGGAGGYLKALINNPLATYAYAVGIGGAAAAAGVNGFGSGAGGSGQIIVREYY